jgi:hypothetical protein
MRTIASLGFLAAVLSGAARADEDVADGAVDEFVRKLSPAEPGGRLIELAKTRAGRRAIGEAMRDCVEWKLRSYEADPQTHFEEHLFARDADGTLRSRPERSADFAQIREALEAARAEFADFNAKADALVARLAETTEVEKRVKAAWQDPRYRLARFAGLSEEDEETLQELLSDGQGVRGDELRELIDAAASSLQKGSASDADVAAALDRLKDEQTRRALGSTFARAFLRSKIGAVDAEGIDRFKELLLRYGLVDGEEVALGHLRKEVEAGLKLMAPLKGRLDELAASLSGGLKTFFTDESSRAALVERWLDERGGGDAVGAFFAELERQEFEPRGDLLGVSANRFADEDEGAKAPATPEEADRELRGTVREFAERRSRFLDMAERCADPATAELFSAPLAATVLERRMGSVARSLARKALAEAPAAFARRYLAGTGDTMAWRPERAAKVDEIVARAREIELRKDDDEDEDEER